MLTLQERIEKLLSKSEAMVLLCSKTSGYWSMIKFVFNIPLVLTSYINFFSCKAFSTKVVTSLIRKYFEPVSIKDYYLTRDAQ